MLFSRILRNPDGGEGGAAPSDEVVTIPREELEALRARAGMHPAGEAEGRRIPPPQLDPLPKEREAEYARELAEHDRKAAEWERAFKSALRDRELATALAGRPLVAGAAPQLIKLWREEFDVYEEGGEFRVTARDGRAVGQAVADWLSGPEYAHFCQPPSRGGTAAPGAARPTSAGGPAPAPRTLGEAVIRSWREATAARDRDPLAPIGLVRRR